MTNYQLFEGKQGDQYWIVHYIVFQLVTAHQGPRLFTWEQLLLSSKAAEPALGVIFLSNFHFIPLNWDWNYSFQHGNVDIKKRNKKKKSKRIDLKED